MLENKYCKTCGGEIILRYSTPIKHYEIINGEIKRADAHTGNWFDDPETEFICSNDAEDDIGKSEDLDRWMDEVEQIFYETGIYDR